MHGMAMTPLNPLLRETKAQVSLSLSVAKVITLPSLLKPAQHSSSLLKISDAPHLYLMMVVAVLKPLQEVLLMI